MIRVSADWNPKQALLKEMLQKPGRFTKAIEICLEMHSLLHISESSCGPLETYEDTLWDGLDEATFRAMTTLKDDTIAWNLWHITRIEDITVNILIADMVQVFLGDDWMGKMNVTIRDTGNAMTTEEIIAFSHGLNMEQLKNYRKEVGKRTKQIIQQLQPDDINRKMVPDRVQRILDEGGVLAVEGSKWLLDFWGKKTVAGLLMMPVTRHQVVHLNDCFRIKEKCRKKS